MAPVGGGGGGGGGGGEVPYKETEGVLIRGYNS